VSVLIPERSIDAWLSIYLWRRFPGVQLWAPQAGWDFAVGRTGRGKVVLLEDKGCQRDGAMTRVTIDLRQLGRYLRDSISSSLTYYVLPDTEDAAVSPRFRRRRAWQVPVLPREAANAETVGQWLYVVSAWRLADFIVRRRRSAIWETTLRPEEVRRLPGARRLFEFCCELEECRAGSVTGGSDLRNRPPGVVPPPEERERFEHQRVFEWLETRSALEQDSEAIAFPESDRLKAPLSVWIPARLLSPA
jgi:hypothetical protein